MENRRRRSILQCVQRNNKYHNIKNVIAFKSLIKVHRPIPKVEGACKQKCNDRSLKNKVNSLVQVHRNRILENRNRTATKGFKQSIIYNLHVGKPRNTMSATKDKHSDQQNQNP